MKEEVMNPSRSLIEGLLEELEALPHRDEQRLDALRQRGVMVLRNIYGPGSRYVTQLMGVGFKPNYLVMKSGAHDKWWNEGVSRMRNLLNTMLAEIDTFPQKVVEANGTPRPTALTLEKIFVAHGHDIEMLSAIESFILKLGLKPVILRNQPSRGRTIVEKIEDYSEVSSAVVLLSPDDNAYPRGTSSSDAKLRARQNVIFELGFFIGKLGRHNVIAVHRTDERFEMPTDYEGVIFTPYDEGGGWKLALAKELQAIGFELDAANLLKG
jgi:predicted nucleotide-binding protein